MKNNKQILFLICLLVLSCLGLGVNEYFSSLPQLKKHKTNEASFNVAKSLVHTTGTYGNFSAKPRIPSKVSTSTFNAGGNVYTIHAIPGKKTTDNKFMLRKFGRRSTNPRITGTTTNVLLDNLSGPGNILGTSDISKSQAKSYLSAYKTIYDSADTSGFTLPFNVGAAPLQFNYIDYAKINSIPNPYTSLRLQSQRKFNNENINNMMNKNRNNNTKSMIQNRMNLFKRTGITSDKMKSIRLNNSNKIDYIIRNGFIKKKQEQS